MAVNGSAGSCALCSSLLMGPGCSTHSEGYSAQQLPSSSVSLDSLEPFNQGEEADLAT